jgi:hypothetical protein
MNVVHDIPVILNSVNLNDDYEGTYENRRAMIYTLAFTMKAYIYGPIKKTGGIIKQAEVNIHSNLDANSTPVAEIVATPGLNANGAPVNYFGVGPAPTTIDIDEIAADDDYGFITTINENI